ncbi:DUF3054 domain-containing protein [Microbacterium sp.]|uniref:DUF3054 domain-containing protein n=1 Tax=Microbacterium sp. TaxID=51671 RepID=UPI003A86D280
MSGSRAVLWAALADVVLVIGFALTGRLSHDEHPLVGLWVTAWPFLAALAVGWLVMRAWRAPAAPVRTGIGVWAVTLVGGMALRALSGQGTAVPFLIVAGLTLALALIGWRAIATAVVRRRASSTQHA